ncbi:MAG: glycosyltransferase, partial [Coleofasciculaceae cyanobacterium]
IIWARTGVSDMLLSGCMGCALLSFFQGYAQPEKAQGKILGLTVKDRWYLAFYILIALAVLTKGPVGIVLPALIIGAFLLYLDNFRQVIQEMHLLPGIALILFITLPWYILVTLANGETYLDSFFGYHNFQRFTGVVNGHQAPWYFYFLVVLIGFAPWSVYLPVAIARLRFWQRESWRSSPRSTHLGLFALFWFVGIFGFFTIAVTKLPSYTLPLLPAAAILVALFWSDQSYWRQVGQKAEGNRQKRFPLFLPSGLFNLVLLLAIAGALFFSPQLVGSDPAVPNLSELLQKSGLPLRGGLIWGITGVIAVLFLLQRRHWLRLWVVNFVGFVAFMIFVLTPASFLIDEARQLPLRELSTLAAEVQQPGEEFLMIGFKKPSVVFYSQRRVNYFPQQKKAMAYIKNTAAYKSDTSSFLILLHQRKLEKTKLEPEEYTPLGRAGAYELIRISQQVVAKS